MIAYRYFDNKEEVFASLRAIRFDHLVESLEAVPKLRSPLEYLRELGRSNAGFAHRTPHAYRLLYMIPIYQNKIYPEVIRAQGQENSLWAKSPLSGENEPI